MLASSADVGGEILFKGLSRPWEGLHTIDTVRRDAAEQNVWFETKYTRAKEKAEIVLTCDEGRLAYTVDMGKDVVDRIVASTPDGGGGELQFSYLQELDQAEGEFVEPKTTTQTRERRRRGILWLLEL